MKISTIQNLIKYSPILTKIKESTIKSYDNNNTCRIIKDK